MTTVAYGLARYFSIAPVILRLLSRVLAGGT
ncbi:MAG: hypothetical protein AB1483_01725 [Candidatus Zixiibacteriota bacterium]